MRLEEPLLFELLLRDPLLALVDDPDELLRAVVDVRLAALLPCELAVFAVFLAAVDPLLAAVFAVLPAVDAALRARVPALLPDDPFDDEPRERDDDEPPLRERDDDDELLLRERDDELLRDEEEREREDDVDARSSFGISALTTSFVSFGICFATKSYIRCSSRRMPFASLTVSLSPTCSASAMIAV